MRTSLENRLSACFLAACISGAACGGQALADEPPANALQTGNDFFCTDPAEITRGPQGNPWIKVEATTKDGIAVSFDLAVRYELPEAQENEDFACLGMGRHVLGLARVIYGAHILESRYVDLPEEGPAMLRAVGTALEREVNTLLGLTDGIAITGVGVRNVKAPGLDEQQGTAMLTTGITFSHPQTPHRDDSEGEGNDRARHITAHSYDLQPVSADIAATYRILPEAFDLFGPDDEGINRIVLDTLHRNSLAALLHWQGACIPADETYIEDEIYTASSEKLDEAGIALLKADLRNIDAPALPPAATAGQGRCYSALLGPSP